MGRVIGTLLVLVLRASTGRAQFPAACDKDKECVGHALTIAITQDKGAQYVDVDMSYRIYRMDTALTFEAWIAPQRQPGKIQYIAGLWGPNKDNNDQWVLYVQDTKIIFALSKDNSYKGESDNTIAIASVPNLYTNGWRHVAAVWDAMSTAARVYVDGILLASATNPLYPCNRLHTPEDRLLPMQIGSCNALYDDTLRHRAFHGQIDEIRLWHRALSGQEIACQRIISLSGNEPGFELYYRCNEAPSAQLLCDATGNNHIGLLRSGAACDTSLRTIPNTYTASPAVVTATLICTEDTTITITLTDTSACGDRVMLSAYGPDAGLFKLPPATLTLAQGVQATFTVQMHSDLIGSVSAGIAVANANSCGNPLYVPLNIQRTTELSYSVGKLKLDTLHIQAHSQGWATQFHTMLSGRREMNCQPNISQVQFPATRVDTFAQPQTVTINVPDITINPDGDYIQIDSVTFDPEQHVFSAHDSIGGVPPWTVMRNQKFKIRVGFLPRAPKLYIARMRIWTSHPCGGFDSTVLVFGSGFAPAYGLQLALFATIGIGRDTIHLTTCDTLVLPVLTSHDVPLQPMNLFYHLGYHTTEL